MEDDGTEIVIKYNQVYTPNPEVCPGKSFPTYKIMMEAVGEELNAAAAYAYAHNLPFLPYTVKCVPKLKYLKEITAAGLYDDSADNT